MRNKIVLSMTLLAAVLLVFQACKKDKNTDPGNNPGGKTPSYRVNVLGTWASKAPKKQSFTLDAATGGWVNGTKGCSFFFPANCLLDKNTQPVTGNVTIELIEYMSKADMLFAGVTVTSGDKLLESGGMFYLMARQNGEELSVKPNSGFSMSVEQSNNTADPMNFWVGQENQDDSLNKVNWKQVDSVELRPKQMPGAKNGTYSMNFDYFKFGYCNIDREWTRFMDLVDKFKIRMPNGCNDTNSTALLLFKNYNCCAWCYWTDEDGIVSTGYGLPVGEVAKVLIYKKTGPGADDLEYAIREFTFTEETELEFTGTTKCTNQELEDMIKAL